MIGHGVMAIGSSLDAADAQFLHDDPLEFTKEAAIGVLLGASLGRAALGASRISTSSAGGAEIVGMTARGVASNGPPHLFSYLSDAEQLAYLANPERGSRFLGQAVHRGTAAQLERIHPGRFQYSTRGPDFVDTVTGELIELTTPGSVSRHLERDPWVNIVTYGLPR